MMLMQIFFITLGLVLIVCLLLVYSRVTSNGFASSSQSSFQIVTVTNQPRDPRLGLLLRSAVDKGGFEKEERVLLNCEAPFSWAKRLRLWRDYYSTLPRDTVVLSVDAFDVIVMAPKKEILDKFDKMGVSLLFGYTDYCWPSECEMCLRYLHESHPRLYSMKRQKMMYLCAGTYIGRAGYLADLLHEHPWAEDVDDQCYFATIFLQPHPHKNKKGMKLDEDNLIFQNTTPTIMNQGLLFFRRNDKEKRPHNAITETRPCVFHFDSYHPSYKELKRGYEQLQHGY